MKDFKEARIEKQRMYSAVIWRSLGCNKALTTGKTGKSSLHRQINHRGLTAGYPACSTRTFK
jgi:hypothetical protein